MKQTKSAASLIAILLLLFNGVGAIYGGISLISRPDGSSISLSASLLDRTPFHSFFVPGIVLLIVNGLFSLVCIVMQLMKYARSGYFIMMQGTLLTGWILIQVSMLHTINMLHYVMCTTGLLLVACGAIIVKSKRQYPKSFALL